MALNIFLHLNAYKDLNPTNNPSMSHFKWSRDLQGLTADKPQSLEFSLAPGESKTLFSGNRTLLNDGTTEFSLLLKSGSTNTYQLKYLAGTAPVFRTVRNISHDATTQVTVTTSGSLATFSSTGGTAFDFSTVSVGDEVSVGSVFNAANQGRFKVLAKTATSITIENYSASDESSIVLGVNFADIFRVYSASGVQIGDKIKIGTGFSTITQATYEVTGVQDNIVEIFSTSILPPESSIVGGTITVYSSAKKLIYIETDKPTDIQVNGINESKIEPFIEATEIKPGMLLKRSVVWNVIVTNNTTDTATLFFISVE